MRCRSLLEVYEYEIEYIKGPKNIIAVALSRLHKKGDIIDDDQIFWETMPNLSKVYAVGPIYPVLSRIN